MNYVALDKVRRSARYGQQVTVLGVVGIVFR